MEIFVMAVMSIIALCIMFAIFHFLDCRPIFIRGYIYWFFACFVIELILMEIMGGAVSSIFNFLGWLLPKVLVIGGIVFVVMSFKSGKDNGDSQNDTNPKKKDESN